MSDALMGSGYGAVHSALRLQTNGWERPVSSRGIQGGSRSSRASRSDTEGTVVKTCRWIGEASQRIRQRPA